MELDSALLAARESAREHAADLRSRALAVDAHPQDMRPHLDSPAYQAIQRGYFPTGYALGDTFTRMSYLEETVWLTELARGDAGALLACPGPALAGLAVNLLGSAEQVERFYEDHKSDRFTKPEEVRARHILIQVPPGASDADRAAARKKADELLARAKGGEDFAALAKEHSDDPGSAVRGGDLGAFPRGRMDPTFEQALKAALRELMR